MNRVYFIFDYFKEAYHINRENKKIYYPQIAFIAIKLMMIIAIGLKVYSWINSPPLWTLKSAIALRYILTYSAIFVVMLLTYGIISAMLECGLYNMYKKCTLYEYTGYDDFSEGIRKYFFKFLLCNIIIFFIWIIASPIIIILGIVTLSLGFAVVPIIINIFLTMWKVSLVSNDYGIFEALKDSYRYARANFLPLTFLQLIHWAFVKGTSPAGNLGSGSGIRNNIGSNWKTPFPWDVPIDRNVINNILEVAKIALMALIPIVTIATLAASLVKMIFEVFFSLTLFVAYKRKFIESDNNQIGEVLS